MNQGDFSRLEGRKTKIKFLKIMGLCIILSSRMGVRLKICGRGFHSGKNPKNGFVCSFH